MAVCVLDASVTVSWFIPSEANAAAEAVLDAVVQGGALAPGLWPLEVANTLLMAGRRRRMTEAQRFRAFATLADLDIAVEPQEVAVIWSRISDLAQAHQLTVYDAAYLELALRQALPLATMDQALIRAAKATGVGALF
jgi:predicted nucleic acid-binding protein